MRKQARGSGRRRGAAQYNVRALIGEFPITMEHGPFVYDRIHPDSSAHMIRRRTRAVTCGVGCATRPRRLAWGEASA
jgi:hypothetical protein